MLRLLNEQGSWLFYLSWLRRPGTSSILSMRFPYVLGKSKRHLSQGIMLEIWAIMFPKISFDSILSTEESTSPSEPLLTSEQLTYDHQVAPKLKGTLCFWFLQGIIFSISMTFLGLALSIQGRSSRACVEKFSAYCRLNNTIHKRRLTRYDL